MKNDLTYWARVGHLLNAYRIHKNEPWIKEGIKRHGDGYAYGVMNTIERIASKEVEETWDKMWDKSIEEWPMFDESEPIETP